MCDIIKLLHIIEYFAEKGNKICQALISKWSILKEIKGVLQCSYFATLRLQQQDLTMSDTFGIWLAMELQLKQVMAKNKSTKLAANMIKAFEIRRQSVFQNDATICAIYLDPRFRSEITAHKNLSTPEYANDKLSALWRRCNAMEESGVNVNVKVTTNKKKKSTGIVRTSFDPSDVSEQLNQYLRRGVQHVAANDDATDISLEIETFDPEWLPMENSVLKFWEDSKGKYPALYDNSTVSSISSILRELCPTLYRYEDAVLYKPKFYCDQDRVLMPKKNKTMCTWHCSCVSI